MAQGNSGEYVHGTHRSEQERLALMNEILNARTVAEVPVRTGDRVLDVGSGLGQMSLAMAKVAGGGGMVVGVERSVEQIARANVLCAETRVDAPIDFREGDAHALPLAPDELGRFDLAFARFLLEHVPDPLGVVKQMLRAVRPGGIVVLADDDHEMLKLHPEPEGFGEFWRGYMQLYSRVGNDPIIGRRLVQLLHQAGGQPRRNSLVWFGGCSGDPMFGAVVFNLIEIVRGAAERMIAQGLVTDAQADSCIAGLRAFVDRPDGAVWYAMSLAIAERPL
ncbi:MAG: methyltransferase domain-containing protein [Phycisphaerae bacterium]|nr:methyltransferase domain-containing protein [Phycisphaerae bacterium]